MKAEISCYKMGIADEVCRGGGQLEFKIWVFRRSPKMGSGIGNIFSLAWHHRIISAQSQFNLCETQRTSIESCSCTQLLFCLQRFSTDIFCLPTTSMVISLTMAQPLIRLNHCQRIWRISSVTKPQSAQNDNIHLSKQRNIHPCTCLWM